MTTNSATITKIATSTTTTLQKRRRRKPDFEAKSRLASNESIAYRLRYLTLRTVIAVK